MKKENIKFQKLKLNIIVNRTMSVYNDSEGISIENIVKRVFIILN